ncbi:hypothetical protein [Alkalitalea saponilacus]|nr:hypothetical protein [Alkalitalea saponilacus]
MLLFVAMPLMAQTDYWEPQTNFTGYVGTEFNYFNGLKGYERDYSIALSEAGFLSSYQPTRDLTITGVLVYRPNFSFEQMLNELNAQYSINNSLNLKAGRFLTPLSPMNTYYYAPVNNSATLPMIITNHEFFPLNMDAVSLNGEVGEDIRFNYNVFAGGFKNSLYQGSGAMGFFATESEYFQNQRMPAESLGYDMITDPNESLQFGGGGYLGININNFISLGAGLFSSDENITTTSRLIRFEEADEFDFDGIDMGDFDFSQWEVHDDHYVRTSSIESKIKKTSFGGNIKMHYSSFSLIGEYWQTKAKLKTFGFNTDLNLKGAYVEISNNFYINSLGSITPYLRYEYHSVPEIGASMVSDNSQEYYRYTAGVNFKPSFETTFKMEYVYYEYGSLDLGGLVLSAIFSF